MRSIRALIVVGASIVTIASSSLASGSANKAAWPMFGFNAAHTGDSPDEDTLGTSNVDRLVLVWSRSTGDPGSSGGSPVVSKRGMVVVPGGDFHVHAFDASSGAPRWVSSSQSESFAGAIARGIVYYGDAQGVRALRISSGEAIWSNRSCHLGQQIDAAPIVADGIVYAGLNDPELIALDADDGACLWKSPARMSYDGGSSPAISNGVVYVGDDGGQLWSVNASDGTVRWHAAAAGSGNSVSSPVAARRRVFASADDEVGAYKASTGVRVWAFGSGGSAPLGTPAFADGTIYVGSTDGHVYAVDASNGAPLWSATIGPSFDVRVSIANGVVYASSDRLYALDARIGSILWSGATGAQGSGRSAPAIANGMVYVQGANARVYAFGLPR